MPIALGKGVFGEQAFQTQIPNSRSFVTNSAGPDDPDAIGCIHTGSKPPRCLMGCLFQYEATALVAYVDASFAAREKPKLRVNPHPYAVVRLRPRVSPVSAVRLQERQTPRCHNPCKRECLEIPRQWAYQCSLNRECAWQSLRATSARSLTHRPCMEGHWRPSP